MLAWGNACSSALRKTITLQKRVVRTINRAEFNSHTDPLFNRSRILKIIATCTNIRSYYLCMILSTITCPALLMTAFIMTMRFKICIRRVNQDNFTFPNGHPRFLMDPECNLETISSQSLHILTPLMSNAPTYIALNVIELSCQAFNLVLIWSN